MSTRNPAKLLREKMDALRVVESSMPRVAMDGAVVGRVTHFVWTYTPEACPIADEKYQLSREQIQELVGLIYDVLDMADSAAGKPRKAKKGGEE